MIDIIGIDKMGIMEVKDMLVHCENALNVLIDTSRLHYIRPILRNIISFKSRLGNIDDNINDYEELLEAIESCLISLDMNVNCLSGIHIMLIVNFIV